MNTIQVQAESHTVKTIRQFWSRCRRVLRKKGITNDMFEDWRNWQSMPEYQPSRHSMKRGKDRFGGEWWSLHTQDEYYDGLENADGTGYKIVFSVDLFGNGLFSYEERNA